MAYVRIEVGSPSKIEMSDKLVSRVIKNGMALAAGQGIHLLTQLALPPAFIFAYGAHGYGEWLVLSAAIGFLTTLDFGLQTFLLNELTALYHRNELDKLHRLQSTGLRILLAIAVTFGFLMPVVFFLPLKALLNLDMSQYEAALTLYLLVLQILINLVSGYINGAFRIFSKAHRGAMWGNVQRAVVVVATLVLVFLNVPIWAIALGQLTVLVPTALVPVFDLRKSAPEIFPTIKYWDPSLAGTTFASSMFFGLFTLNNFLMFQAPVLILNHFLGPKAVVSFTIGRTLFSLVRQALTLIQNSIAPEITRLNGIGDKERLLRLYQFSESTVLSGALVLNVSAYLLSPLLLWLWLKHPELYNPETYLLLMAVSTMMSVKEYKLYFQYATNHHIETSIMTFLTYLLMVAASFVTIGLFEVKGLLVAWLLTELLQIGFLHAYNKKLFAGMDRIPIAPVLKLVFVLAVIMLNVHFLPLFSMNFFTFIGMATVLSVILILIGISYFLFDVGKMLRKFNLSGI